MGLIPVGDSDFFFVPRSCHCWLFHLSRLIYRAENSPSLSFITKIKLHVQGHILIIIIIININITTIVIVIAIVIVAIAIMIMIMIMIMIEPHYVQSLKS